MLLTFSAPSDASFRARAWLEWLRVNMRWLEELGVSSEVACAVDVADVGSQTHIHMNVSLAPSGQLLNRFTFGTGSEPGSASGIVSMMERGAFQSLRRYALHYVAQE